MRDKGLDISVSKGEMMRHPKGSIQPSRLDTALLSQILHSGFISRSQLVECLKLRHFRESQKAVYNRLRVLAEHKYLEKMVGKLSGQDAYCLLECGEEVLRRAGLCFTGRGFRKTSKILTPKKEDKPELKVIEHWLDINDIFLALLRRRKLRLWESEITIRTLADIGWNAYGKEYDAVLIFEEFQSLSIGLEYERTPKAKERYSRIVAEIEGDRKIDAVIYVTPSKLLQRVLEGRFAKARKPIFVSSLHDFKENLLGAEVSTSEIANFRRPLIDFLRMLALRKSENLKSSGMKKPAG